MKFNWRRMVDASTVSRDVDEVRELATRWVKEETLDPIKNLGRYAGFGCLGSLFVSFGSLFGLIGILRLLQSEISTFRGNLSWVPYLIVIVLGCCEMAIVGWRVVSGPAKRRRTKKEEA